MLTARFIATAPTGRHLDSRGLYLEVSSTGRKRYVLRYTRDKRVSEAALGSAEFVTLAQARERAFDFRRKIANGETTRVPQLVTFGALAAEVLAQRSQSFKQGASTFAGWERRLRYTKPISDRSVGSIELADVLAILKPIWTSKPTMANGVRATIEAVLDAAKVKGLRSGDNPAKWRETLSYLLPTQRSLVRGHNEAMAYAEVAAFMRRLEAEGSVISRSLRLTILCALRKNETAGLVWSNIQGDVLVIPAERMKTKREHRVPLSSGALAVLEEQSEIFSTTRSARNEDGFIFPSPIHAGRPLHLNAFNNLMKRLGAGSATPHGFRSSFRDFCGDETDFPREIAEAALAHVVGGVEGSYRRGDALEKRKALMQAWSNFICQSCEHI